VSAMTMSEAQLQGAVMDLCRLRGALVHHCRPAWLPSGKFATPIQGTAGFVDLVILGAYGLLFRELKTERGQVSKAQAAWIGRLTMLGFDCQLWRPSDLASGRILAEIERITRG
jgi:hypothetical protein